MAKRDAYHWVALASERDTPIDEGDLDAHFGDEAGFVRETSVSLYAQLVSSTTDYPSSLVNNHFGGNGFEAMGVVMRRFEPRTPLTKGTVLKATITNPPSKRAEDTGRHLLQVEELRCRLWQATRRIFGVTRI